MPGHLARTLFQGEIASLRRQSIGFGLIVVELTGNVVRPMLDSGQSGRPATLAFVGAIGGVIERRVSACFSARSSWHA